MYLTQRMTEVLSPGVKWQMWRWPLAYF